MACARDEGKGFPRDMGMSGVRGERKKTTVVRSRGEKGAERGGVGLWAALKMERPGTVRA